MISRMPSAIAAAPDHNGHILLVEDDPEIAAMLCETMIANGFKTSVAGSAREMDLSLKQQVFRLIVLDIMLPDEDGISICRRLRAISPVPIIMLTALGERSARLLGFDSGADDYIVKPFDTTELLARIRALLRRAAAAGPPVIAPASDIEFSGWLIKSAERQVYNPGGARVTLTSAEFDLLWAFSQNPGRVLSRHQLLSLTHAGGAGPDDRSIDVHVGRLRQKIEPDQRNPAFIKTVRLGGYMFAAIVTTV